MLQLLELAVRVTPKELIILMEQEVIIRFAEKRGLQCERITYTYER